jgi:hypothetical protein
MPHWSRDVSDGYAMHGRHCSLYSCQLALQLLETREQKRVLRLETSPRKV